MASARRRATRLARRALVGLALLALVVLAAAAVAVAHSQHAAPAVVAQASGDEESTPAVVSDPHVVEPQAGVAAPQSADAPAPSTPDARPVDDVEIRRELRQLKRLASADDLQVGPSGRVLPDGRAVAPADAPAIVRDVILTGNVIARTPYLWGGGHGSWSAVGYDCSGSVSFALAGAGLLDTPLTSGLLASWGAPGPGRWITIYANATHVFMVVAGLRFDTGALRGSGTRWQPTGRPTTGFVARHPEGL